MFGYEFKDKNCFLMFLARWTLNITAKCIVGHFLKALFFFPILLAEIWQENVEKIKTFTGTLSGYILNISAVFSAALCSMQ